MNFTLLSLIIVVYLFAIGYLAYLGYTRTKTAKDYLVAGRSVNPYVMAVSYGATFVSTSAIVGFGGVAGLFGMGLLWLTVCNVFVGIFIAFIFFGKRTRKMGHNLNAHTFPEFLGKRYQSKFLQAIGGLIIFLGMPLYSAVVLIGGARFIEEALAVNFHVALLVFSVIIAAYVIAGGLKAVMYVDALQGTIMFIGMLCLVVLTYIKLGGVTAAHTALTNMTHLVPVELTAMGHRGWTSMPQFNSSWWWYLVSTLVLGVGVGVLAQPQLIVRFMTVKSNRELNRAVLIGGVFILVITGGAFVVGALSNVFFYSYGTPQGMIAITVAKGNSDLIIPTYVHMAMPSWFVYLFMITLLSAAMSTLSSQFHTMGTSLGRDFCYNIFCKEDRSIIVTKVGIVIAIVVSIILGYRLPAGIIARGTAIFFGMCAATFLPAYFAAIYWKRATRIAAIGSVCSGFLSSLFCFIFLHRQESIFLGLCQRLFGTECLIEKFPYPVMDPILISLPISILVLMVITYFSKQLVPDHIETCFKRI